MSTISPLLRELDVSVVERDVNAYLATHPSIMKSAPPLVSLASLHTPSTQLCEQALAYSRSEVDEVIFNHSNRVYYIGQAMKQHLAQPSPLSYKVNDEAYYITCLLHDLGVGPAHHKTTRLSFEYYGAILARDFVLKHSPTDLSLADEVCESILRHTNFVSGKMTTTGQLIQLSTTLDVIGANTAHIHKDTYLEIESKWPRLGCNQHFAWMMEEEMRLKPWSHITVLAQQDGCAKIRCNPFTKDLDDRFQHESTPNHMNQSTN